MWRIFFFGILLPAAAADGAARADPSGGAAIVRLTDGAPTRIVWCQEEGAGRHSSGTSGTLRLMGWDSEDARGERPILAARGNYAKPLLTPGGRLVVFSDVRDRMVRVVNWDGSGLRPVAPGYAVAAWRDPASGHEWVYLGDTSDDAPTRLRAVRRHRLDAPEISEPVWTRTLVEADNFQLSADGLFACANHPWPDCGLLSLPDGGIRRYGRGCWPSLAPDNSLRFWIFDGSHRALTLFAPESDAHWVVPINRAPGIDGYEVYHPRWSRHPRFLVMTGPYKVGEGENRIRGGGPEVEIYLGRFSPDFKAIEQWARVTWNDQADFYPDAWIDAPPAPAPPPRGARRAASVPPWPVNRHSLVFLWDHRNAANEAPAGAAAARATCRVEPRGRARFGRHGEMLPAGGLFEADPVHAASLFEACVGTLQIGLELVVTPAAVPASGPARILAFASGPGAFNIVLVQDRSRLALRVRSGRADPGAEPWLDLGPLEAGVPRHVVVTARPGALAWYLDGRPAGERRDLHGGLWAPHPLVFGNERAGGFPWRGAIEGVACYARWIGPDEARSAGERSLARFAGRRPASRVVLDGRLVEKTRTPDPASIAPYRRALAAHRYAVERVLDGACPAPDILAAQWVILDAAVLPEADRASNRVYRLTLEPFDEHPELEGERLILDSDAVQLPLFYETEAAPAGRAP